MFTAVNEALTGDAAIASTLIHAVAEATTPRTVKIPANCAPVFSSGYDGTERV